MSLSQLSVVHVGKFFRAPREQNSSFLHNLFLKISNNAKHFGSNDKNYITDEIENHAESIDNTEEKNVLRVKLHDFENAKNQRRLTSCSLLCVFALCARNPHQPPHHQAPIDG